jgi:hypothetical protein
MLAVFGDHPELVVDDFAAHRGVPWFACLAAHGFQHGHRQLPAYRIDDQPLYAMDELPFQISRLAHIPDS